MANIPVVFCFDSRIILGASVTIKSLIDCAKETTNYDIRIFHSDINLKDQKNISKLTENTRHNIAFHYINPDLFKDAPKNKGSWTEIVYYRLLAPEILKEYDKVIYSDVDVLFKGDLEELYSIDINDYEMAMVRAEKNTPNIIEHRYFEENKNDYIYWSGLILYNSKRFREKKILNKLYKNIETYKNKLKAYDLDLINVTCQNILPLDLKYCVLQGFFYNDDYAKIKEYEYLKFVYNDEEIKKAKNSAIIIHYAGYPGKPWRMKKPYSNYQEYIDKLPKELKKYTFRDLRKKIFSKK